MAAAGYSLTASGTQQRAIGLPKRGLVGVALVLCIGMAIFKADSSPIQTADAAILAAMATVAVIGAKQARRLVEQQTSPEAPHEDAVIGPWMTVVINPSDPSEGAGVTARPKSPTRDDPERRSLFRRATEKAIPGRSRR